MSGATKCRESLFAIAASASVLALGMQGANAQTFELTDQDKTPAKCGAEFKTSDMLDYKAPKAKRPYHIEFSVPMWIPYLQDMLYGMQMAAKDAGVTVTVDAGKGFQDPAAQISQVENALTHKPDALLINPSDSEGMAPTIDDIVDGGTPVFDVGSLSTSQKSIKIVQDDFRTGQAGAEAVAKILPQGGQGIVMAGPPNATWAHQRLAGFLDGLKQHPNIKVIDIVASDNSASDGLTKFSNVAEANPKFDFIFVSEFFVLQPQSVPAEYHKAHYVAGGLTSVTLPALKDGFASALLLDYGVSTGYVALAVAVHKLNGDPVAQYNCLPTGAIFKSDLSNPFWLQTNMTPDDIAAAK
jgi:ribose transport system substrate-binding protein